MTFIRIQSGEWVNLDFVTEIDYYTYEEKTFCVRLQMTGVKGKEIWKSGFKTMTDAKHWLTCKMTQLGGKDLV
jgi:hypothetical protein